MKSDGSPVMFEDPFCMEHCEFYGDCLDKFPEEFCNKHGKLKKKWEKTQGKSWWQRKLEASDKAELDGALNTIVNKGTVENALLNALDVVHRDMARCRDEARSKVLDGARVALMKLLKAETGAE
jgi:hypothetical protein